MLALTCARMPSFWRESLKLDTPAGVQKGALVDEDARVEQPCYIAAGARVERGAGVDKYAVIGAGAVVEARASVKRSILWPGARWKRGAGARLRAGGPRAPGSAGAGVRGNACWARARGRSRARSSCPASRSGPTRSSARGAAGEQPRVGRGLATGLCRRQPAACRPRAGGARGAGPRRLPAPRRVFAGADALGGIARRCFTPARRG